MKNIDNTSKTKQERLDFLEEELERLEQIKSDVEDAYYKDDNKCFYEEKCLDAEGIDYRDSDDFISFDETATILTEDGRKPIVCVGENLTVEWYNEEHDDIIDDIESRIDSLKNCEEEELKEELKELKKLKKEGKTLVRYSNGEIDDTWIDEEEFGYGEFGGGSKMYRYEQKGIVIDVDSLNWEINSIEEEIKELNIA